MWLIVKSVNILWRTQTLNNTLKRHIFVSASYVYSVEFQDLKGDPIHQASESTIT
jgi:hypothetical protein